MVSEVLGFLFLQEMGAGVSTKLNEPPKPSSFLVGGGGRKNHQDFPVPPGAREETSTRAQDAEDEAHLQPQPDGSEDLCPPTSILTDTLLSGEAPPLCQKTSALPAAAMPQLTCVQIYKYCQLLYWVQGQEPKGPSATPGWCSRPRHTKANQPAGGLHAEGLGQTYLKPYHFLADDGRNPFKVPFVLCHTRLPLQREEARCFQGRGGEEALAPLYKRFRGPHCWHERCCRSKAQHSWSSLPRRDVFPACCKLSKEATGARTVSSPSCSFRGFLRDLLKAGLSLGNRYPSLQLKRSPSQKVPFSLLRSRAWREGAEQRSQHSSFPTSEISSLACCSLSGLLAHSSLASISLFFCSMV